MTLCEVARGDLFLGYELVRTLLISWHWSKTSLWRHVDVTFYARFHTVSKVTRGGRLFGIDPLTGKDFSHRKAWIEKLIKHFAGQFAIDVLSFSVMSNHHHQLLRSRPDVAKTWDDTEVARRWLMICPKRKDENNNPMDPLESELDVIRNNPAKVEEIRVRLSDVSWWMRLINQDVAQKANKEDDASGRFFEDRFKGIPVIDEATVLACSVYVDLNWIRACMADTIEQSDFTSGQRRFQALKAHRELFEGFGGNSAVAQRLKLADSFLAPVNLCEATESPGPIPSVSDDRCSDKGFVPMTAEAYLELVDWSARQVASGKPGSTPTSLPPVLERLGLKPTVWLKLVKNFDDLFKTMAGFPENIDQQRAIGTGRRFNVPKQTREALSQSA